MAGIFSTSEIAYRKPRSGDIWFKASCGEWIQFDKKTTIADIAQILSKDISDTKYDHKSYQFVDFGGVAEHFLGGRGDTTYVDNPPKIRFERAYIYSFVPTSKFKNLNLMASTAEKSGFVGTIILTEKKGARGRVFAPHLYTNFI